MTITEMQNAILAKGWQFTEHVFNDGNYRNCMVNFTRHESPHAFSIEQRYKMGPRPKVVGWGRFHRQEAWERAYQTIVIEGKPYPKCEPERNFATALDA